MQTELRRRSAPQVTARISYGPGPHQFGELRLPEGPGPHPVVVIIHGGCWLSIADLTYMDHFAGTLNRAGWATWSLEFRTIDQEGGGWPRILEDVALGTDHLRHMAEEYPLSTSRVVASGHSSGGHLALWLGARESLPHDLEGGPRLRGGDPLPLAGVVGLAAIADLADYTRYTRCGPTIVSDFLGEPVDPSSERFRLSDPGSLLPASAPQLLLMGELDPIVPPSHGEHYTRRALESGQVVEVATVPGAGHFELVAPWTAPWEQVWERLGGFLRSVWEQGVR
ncbi:MAG: alpha/beta hydrolase [Gemmatimonadales bacterium]|nr:MAG: alpha/beta hydrolase [Gemmatimonadales bacterium]